MATTAQCGETEARSEAQGSWVETTCSKRGYDSEAQAKRAHRKAHYRIRTYRCELCGKVHATNNEKHC